MSKIKLVALLLGLSLTGNLSYGGGNQLYTTDLEAIINNKEFRLKYPRRNIFKITRDANHPSLDEIIHLQIGWAPDYSKLVCVDVGISLDPNGTIPDEDFHGPAYYVTSITEMECN